jgi:hypothetical protein
MASKLFTYAKRKIQAAIEAHYLGYSIEKHYADYIIFRYHGNWLWIIEDLGAGKIRITHENSSVGYVPNLPTELAAVFEYQYQLDDMFKDLWLFRKPTGKKAQIDPKDTRKNRNTCKIEA